MPTTQRPDPYYDELSDGYDELHGDEQKRKARIVAQSIHTTSSSLILDAGGGSGLASEEIPGKHTVLDPSDRLLKIARKRKLKTVKGVAESLPFPNLSFDLVISLTAIHHFSDPSAALTEMKRVSRGVIVVSVLKKARNSDTLDELINQTLSQCKKIDDLHDTIYIWRRKQ